MTIERIGTIRNRIVADHRQRAARSPPPVAEPARPSDVPTITTVDPATGADLATYDTHDEAAVDAALGRPTRRTWLVPRPLAERTDLLRSVGKLLTERREEYAALITAEMGKPLAEALAEIDKCAWNCEIVADSAPGWLADHEVASRGRPVVAVLRAARRRLRGDAVELPVLAGAPLRERRARRRQRGGAQALART